MRNKRVFVTVTQEDYDYLQKHFIKITDLCNCAIKDFIAFDKQRYEALKHEIPANVEKGPACDRPSN